MSKTLNKNVIKDNPVKISQNKGNEENRQQQFLNNYFLSNKTLAAPIKNSIGEQNCFLNVIIHLLFQVDEIKKFLTEKEIKFNQNNGLLIALKECLVNYNDYRKSSKVYNNFILDPTLLRSKLSELFKGEDKFQLKQMSDPVEALFVILNSFHSFDLGEANLKTIIDKQCKPYCLSHSLFWIYIFQQEECICGATSEILPYDINYYFFEAYVNEILTFCEKEPLVRLNSQFMKFLKRLNSKTESKCPERCNKSKVIKNMNLIKHSPYFTLNLTWNQTSPKMQDITKCFFTLSTYFNSSELFSVTNRDESFDYELFYVICYYGGHYICFIKYSIDNNDLWEYCDDNNISKLTSWRQLVLKAIKSHFFPVVLIYRLIKKGNYNDYNDKFTHSELDELYRYSVKIDDDLDKSRKRNRSNFTSRVRPQLIDYDEKNTNYPKDKNMNLCNSIILTDNMITKERDDNTFCLLDKSIIENEPEIRLNKNIGVINSQNQRGEQYENNRIENFSSSIINTNLKISQKFDNNQKSLKNCNFSQNPNSNNQTVINEKFSIEYKKNSTLEYKSENNISKNGKMLCNICNIESKKSSNICEICLKNINQNNKNFNKSAKTFCNICNNEKKTLKCEICQLKREVNNNNGKMRSSSTLLRTSIITTDKANNNLTNIYKTSNTIINSEINKNINKNVIMYSSTYPKKPSFDNVSKNILKEKNNLDNFLSSSQVNNNNNKNSFRKGPSKILENFNLNQTILNPNINKIKMDKK